MSGIARKSVVSSVSLPATTGYPEGYILISAGSIYKNISGTWTVFSGGAGATGATGPVGATGAGGGGSATGATGPAGTNGATGATGPVGATGAGGGGSATVRSSVAGPTVATNPTAQTLHTIAVPAGSAIHYMWCFTVEVNNAGSAAYAYPDSPAQALAQQGLTVYTNSSGSKALPYVGLLVDDTEIGVATYRDVTIEGVATNATASPVNCIFVLEENNAVGTADIFASELVYWIG